MEAAHESSRYRLMYNIRSRALALMYIICALKCGEEEDEEEKEER